MVAIGHSSVGSMVGLLTYHTLQPTFDPYVSLIAAGAAGLLSHYITDLIPHGHFFTSTKKNYLRKIGLTIIFDLACGALLFLTLAYLRYGLSFPLLAVLFGIGGAQLPDIVEQGLHALKLKRWGFLKWEGDLHEITHWHGKGEQGLPLGWYDIWQIGSILLAALVVSS